MSLRRVHGRLGDPPHPGLCPAQGPAPSFHGRTSIGIPVALMGNATSVALRGVARIARGATRQVGQPLTLSLSKGDGRYARGSRRLAEPRFVVLRQAQQEWWRGARRIARCAVGAGNPLVLRLSKDERRAHAVRPYDGGWAHHGGRWPPQIPLSLARERARVRVVFHAR